MILHVLHMLRELLLIKMCNTTPRRLNSVIYPSSGRIHYWRILRLATFTVAVEQLT